MAGSQGLILSGPHKKCELWDGSGPFQARECPALAQVLFFPQPPPGEVAVGGSEVMYGFRSQVMCASSDPFV